MQKVLLPTKEGYFVFMKDAMDRKKSDVAFRFTKLFSNGTCRYLLEQGAKAAVDAGKVCD